MSVFSQGSQSFLRSAAVGTAAFALAFALAACSGPSRFEGEGPREVLGTVFGAVGGGLLGAQIGGSAAATAAGTAVGVLGGGLIGKAIGRDLDAAARSRAAAAESSALREGGRKTHWSDDEKGVSGDVVFGPIFRSDRRECRDYSHTLFRGGRSETAFGVACRDAEGGWTIVD